MQHPSEGLIQTTAPLGKFSKTPLSIYQHAPSLGEHIQEIIQHLSISEEYKLKIIQTQETTKG